MSEQELTRAILDALKARGIWCWRTNTGVAKMPGGRVRFGIVGGGDITGVLPGGRHFELEVKLPDGKWKVTPEQEAHGARIRALGGGWAVVRSVEEAIAAVTPTVTVSPTAVSWARPSRSARSNRIRRWRCGPTCATATTGMEVTDEH